MKKDRSPTRVVAMLGALVGASFAVTYALADNDIFGGFASVASDTHKLRQSQHPTQFTAHPGELLVGSAGTVTTTSTATTTSAVGRSPEALGLVRGSGPSGTVAMFTGADAGVTTTTIGPSSIKDDGAGHMSVKNASAERQAHLGVSTSGTVQISTNRDITGGYDDSGYGFSGCNFSSAAADASSIDCYTSDISGGSMAWRFGINANGVSAVNITTSVTAGNQICKSKSDGTFDASCNGAGVASGSGTRGDVPSWGTGTATGTDTSSYLGPSGVQAKNGNVRVTGPASGIAEEAFAIGTSTVKGYVGVDGTHSGNFLYTSANVNTAGTCDDPTKGAASFGVLSGTATGGSPGFAWYISSAGTCSSLGTRGTLTAAGMSLSVPISASNIVGACTTSGQLPKTTDDGKLPESCIRTASTLPVVPQSFFLVNYAANDDTWTTLVPSLMVVTGGYQAFARLGARMEPLEVSPGAATWPAGTWRLRIGVDAASGSPSLSVTVTRRTSGGTLLETLGTLGPTALAAYTRADVSASFSATTYNTSDIVKLAVSITGGTATLTVTDALYSEGSDIRLGWIAMLDTPIPGPLSLASLWAK